MIMPEQTALLPIEQDTGLVTWTIKVNGTDVPSAILIRSIVVHTEANRIPSALICIEDGDVMQMDWAASNDTFFVPGNEIEILAGYQGINETIFKGIVTRHSLRARLGRTELQVECRDKAVLMTVARNSALYEDQKDSDIASTLLGNFGLSGDIEDTPVTHAEMVQYDVTDWDFLMSRIGSVGFISVAHDGQVDIIKPAVASSALATLRFGTNLLEFDMQIDGLQQYGGVKAQSWDPSAQELLEAEAADPGWVNPGNLDPAEISSSAGAEEFILRQPGTLSEEEVQSWADTKLLRSRMAFVCGRAKVQGFATALPGITVALEGLGDRFNGLAWISGVRHEIVQGNWLTDLQMGLTPKQHAETFKDQSHPASALLPGINGLHTGIVTALEGDPASESRIRVKIPSIGLDGEGSWARVATLDAGNNRGTFFLPEIDDEVLVGFLDDDPRQPVILGGLHSSAKAPPLTAADDNHEKGYTSRSGMHILFNDDKKVLTIDTPGGNKLALDEDKGEINITDQNGNKIVLSSSGIVIESAGDLTLKASKAIKMESQTDLGIKAGTQFKAEGTAGLEVSSSAVTVVKGSLVQIN